jgi:hypothetical protein
MCTKNFFISDTLAYLHVTCFSPVKDTSNASSSLLVEYISLFMQYGMPEEEVESFTFHLKRNASGEGRLWLQTRVKKEKTPWSKEEDIIALSKMRRNYPLAHETVDREDGRRAECVGGATRGRCASKAGRYTIHQFNKTP